MSHVQTVPKCRTLRQGERDDEVLDDVTELQKEIAQREDGCQYRWSDCGFEDKIGNFLTERTIQNLAVSVSLFLSFSLSHTHHTHPDRFAKEMRLRGKTYDFTLRYKHISKLFLLPRKENAFALVTTALYHSSGCSDIILSWTSPNEMRSNVRACEHSNTPSIIYEIHSYHTKHTSLSWNTQLEHTLEHNTNSIHIRHHTNTQLRCAEHQAPTLEHTNTNARTHEHQPSNTRAPTPKHQPMHRTTKPKPGRAGWALRWGTASPEMTESTRLRRKSS